MHEGQVPSTFVTLFITYFIIYILFTIKWWDFYH